MKKVIYKILMYRCLVRMVAAMHLGIILLNIVSVPFVIALEPFYIWMPVITFLVSPMIGGTYCMFNRMENHYRRRALMPLIDDRLGALIEYFKSRGIK